MVLTPTDLDLCEEAACLVPINCSPALILLIIPPFNTVYRILYIIIIIKMVY